MLIFRAPHVFLLAILSGCLNFLSYPNYNFYFLEWFAFIPLLYAIRYQNKFNSYILGLTTGVVGISGGYPWIQSLASEFVGWPFPIYYLSVPIHAFISGQVFGIICWVYKWVEEKTAELNFPRIFLFPFIFIGIWSFYPMLFPFKFGAGQMEYLPLVQPIDITGDHGLDFVLILNNVTFYHLIHRRQKTNWFAFIPAIGFVITWIVVGHVKYNDWNEEIASWKTETIGIVQPNRKASFGKKKPEPGYSLTNPWELEKTRELAKKGARIVVWPEGHFFGYDYYKDVKRSFHKTMHDFDVDLIFEDGTRELKNGKRKLHRTAIWISNKGQFKGYSHKTILVPFGEYIPFQDAFGFILDWLDIRFVSLSRGNGPIVFSPRKINAIPVICYESIHTAYVADGVARAKSGQVIVVFSQDGWYGNSSQQVKEHSILTNLRAIENRTPLIHVIVNGPSYVITPTGKTVFESGHLMRGAWTAKMPHSPESGGSFYTRNPGLFINFVRLILIFTVAFAYYQNLISREKNRKKKSKKKNKLKKILKRVSFLS